MGGPGQRKEFFFILPYVHAIASFSLGRCLFCHVALPLLFIFPSLLRSGSRPSLFCEHQVFSLSFYFPIARMVAVFLAGGFPETIRRAAATICCCVLSPISHASPLLVRELGDCRALRLSIVVAEGRI